MSTDSFNWSEIIKGKKGIFTSDNQSCGNIIAEEGEYLIAEEGAVTQHFYKIPKSKISRYDGAQLVLDITYADLKSYEERTENQKIGSIGDSISDKVGVVTEKLDDVKDKAVDTTKGVTHKTKDTITQSVSKTSSKTTSASSNQEREFEEGAAGTETGRKEDPLTEYRDKEAMTPAKIKEHEPTTLKRKMTEKIAGPGQEKVLQKNRYGVAERARRMK